MGEEFEVLSGIERLSFCAAWCEHDGESGAMFYTGSTHRTVPLEELLAADGDDYAAEMLFPYASGGTWGPT